MCFTPEEVAAYAPMLGLAADVSDADFRAKLLSEYDATAPVVAATAAVVAERDEAKEDAATARQEVAALSAALANKEQEVMSLSGAVPKAPDAVTLGMYAENVAAKREAAVAAGAVSEAQAKGLDALLADASGQPTALALSAAGPARKPLAFAVWDWVKGLSAGDAVRTGNAVARAAGTAPPPQYPSRDVLGLSGAGGRQDDADDPTAEAREWEARQARMRGLAPLGT